MLSKKISSITITTNDADIISKVAISKVFPEIALEMIAVRKGLAKEEGIIVKKIEFESYIKNKIWIFLHEQDARWQRNLSVSSVRYSSPHINFLLVSDFAYIDEDNKRVHLVICDFSEMQEKEIKKVYSEKSYLLKNVAKDIWKDYKVSIIIWHYDSSFYAYNDTSWIYDPGRVSCFCIKRSNRFDIKKSLQFLDRYIQNIHNYTSKPIPFNDQNIEVQHLIERLKSIYLNVRLSLDALNMVNRRYVNNERRLRNYIQSDKELSSLKELIDCFHYGFHDWYNRLLNEEDTTGAST